MSKTPISPLKMKVINSIHAMRQWSHSIHLKNEKISFVPTMGYLHEGHLVLIRKARTLSENTLVSIFINPTQFAPGEDLDSYPRDIERDLKLLESEEVSAVFVPESGEMYSSLHQTYVVNQEISGVLCGISRPDHFKGVTTVVAKLFNIIDPDFSIFGQKDAQQAVILQNMVKDLNFKTEIIIEAIVREKDGLAMSSRNKYLTADQRKNALVLSQSLDLARERFAAGPVNVTSLQKQITEKINNTPGCRADYVEFLNAETLQQDIHKGDQVLLALAVFVGSTRLIDNIILTFDHKDF